MPNLHISKEIWQMEEGKEGLQSERLLCALVEKGLWSIKFLRASLQYFQSVVSSKKENTKGIKGATNSSLLLLSFSHRLNHNYPRTHWLKLHSLILHERSKCGAYFFKLASRKPISTDSSKLTGSGPCLPLRSWESKRYMMLIT